MNPALQARAELARRTRLAANRVIVLSHDSQGWRYRGEPVDADQADQLRARAGTLIVIKRAPAPLPMQPR